KVWDVKKQRLLKSFESSTYNIAAVAFDASAKLLATGSFDGTARVFDVKTGKEVLAVAGHLENIGRGLSRDITDVAFTKDGRLVTAGADATVRFFDIKSGKPKGRAFGAFYPYGQ